MSFDKITEDQKQFTMNWQYLSDSEQWGTPDCWKILRKKDANGKYVGDCEDFALTWLYISKNRSLFKTIIALITGEAKVIFVRTRNNGGHAILKYQNYYVDNWTMTPVDLDHMKEIGHQFGSKLYSPLQTIIKIGKGFYKKKKTYTNR